MPKRRDSIQGQLQPDPGVEYGPKPRAANYPAGPGIELSPDVVAGVAHALHAAGWPPVRHKTDFYRLAVALRWYSSGARISGPRWRRESL
ncbi:hypothetical protein F4561_005077 [Lipingzhangella halophila]|uniref:Uncharacterized protein n=1 Tax=Lipingzhangella halophila TaxID=1783352 RepID=A0A7W7W4K4_9ACTN|nr:hypothetical protein [Lipingzhangella halophila]